MNDLIAMAAMIVCGFVLGRLTYSPERWVEDKMSDIERRIFDRMSSFMSDRMKFGMDRMREEIMENLKDLKANSEVVRIQAGSKEEAVRQIIAEFRKRHIPEPQIKEHVTDVLNIEEDMYDRIARE